jgi:hypothetical protein
VKFGKLIQLGLPRATSVVQNSTLSPKDQANLLEAIQMKLQNTAGAAQPQLSGGQRITQPLGQATRAATETRGGPDVMPAQ